MKLLDRTCMVSDFVTQNPSVSGLFERLGIDFCCQGRQSLVATCEQKGLDVDSVMQQIAEIPVEVGLGSLSLTRLADHVVALHHEYLRESLPILTAQVDRVATVHGPAQPELVELQSVFRHFAREMREHMDKEEQILFPLIRRLDSGVGVPGAATSLPRILHVMESDHVESGSALQKMRQLTHDYANPEGACGTYREMLKGLVQLEEDTHIHVHTENHILFPRALSLATGSSQGL